MKVLCTSETVLLHFNGAMLGDTARPPYRYGSGDCTYCFYYLFVDLRNSNKAWEMYEIQ
jgi:hypothetical protein